MASDPADAPASSPFLVFQSWYKEAEESSTSPLRWALKPHLAFLTTCSKEGQPSSRVLIAKLNTERDGFTFCGDIASRKAKELSVNPQASLLFYWSVPVIRQVRVEGKVERLPGKASEDFSAYPRELQVALTVNYEIAQKEFKGGKAELSKLRNELAEKYADESVPIPVPQYRTGYLLVPTRVEFNEGTMLDLDNFQYTRTSTEPDWTFKLLV